MDNIIEDLEKNQQNDGPEEKNPSLLITEEEEKLAEEQKNLSEIELKTLYDEAIILKNKGNELFFSQAFEESVELYTRALSQMPYKFSKERSILYHNRFASRWKLIESETNVKKYSSYVEDLDKSIALNPDYLKPYIRRAQIKKLFGDEHLDGALEDYQKAKEINGKSNIDLEKELTSNIIEIQKQIDERNEKLKTEMMSKLKDLGNLCLRPFGLSTNNFALESNENGGYSIKFNP